MGYCFTVVLFQLVQTFFVFSFSVLGLFWFLCTCVKVSVGLGCAFMVMEGGRGFVMRVITLGPVYVCQRVQRPDLWSQVGN